MPEGTADIQTFFLRLAQPEGDDQVSDESHHCHGEHDGAVDLRRDLQAPGGLEEDETGDGENGHGVDDGDNDADTVVAEGHRMRSRAVCLAQCVGGQRQGYNIGQDVSGIGQKGQAIGNQAAGHFGNENDARKDDAQG